MFVRRDAERIVRLKRDRPGRDLALAVVVVCQSGGCVQRTTSSPFTEMAIVFRATISSASTTRTGRSGIGTARQFHVVVLTTRVVPSGFAVEVSMTSCRRRESICFVEATRRPAGPGVVIASFDPSQTAFARSAGAAPTGADTAVPGLRPPSAMRRHRQRDKRSRLIRTPEAPPRRAAVMGTRAVAGIAR
jgi:hypothetical protein